MTLKQWHRVLITVASFVIGATGIVGALIYVNRTDPVPTAGTTEISRETLAQSDGRNGNQCYVAVDGTVYLIEGKDLWVEGQHLPSGGQAMCGRDLSAVIDKAPHGRSKLPTLTVVGRLAP